MLWALGRRPCLLFPARLLECLSVSERATLFAHELAHFRRRDHWVRLVEAAASVLYWWHPVLWWARRQLREAEEQCCDAWVVSTLDGAKRTYATALLQTIAFLSQARSHLPAAASGIGQVRHLRRRLTMIMQGQSSWSLSWRGCLVLVGLGLLLLPLLPIRAQAPGRSSDADTDRRIQELKKAILDLEAARATEKQGTKPNDRRSEVEK